MTVGTRRPGAAGWLAEAYESLRAHAGLSVLVLAYVLIALAVGAAFGDARRISVSLYTYHFNVVTVIFGEIFLIAHAIYIVFVVRPERPIKAFVTSLRSKYLTQRRLFNAVPIIVLLSIFSSVCTSLKAMIPLMHQYDWDAALTAWDTALHFGIPPWRLLQPVLGYPVLTGVVSVMYGSWMVVLAACLFWQAFSERDPRLRMQFFMTYVLCFALLGNLAATWLASGGPCYYGRLVAGPNPYAPLMRYLNQANQQVPLGWSIGVQDMLWNNYTRGSLEFGSGISAMPSMHVAGATLCALLGWRANRRLGMALIVYTGIIMIGSVHLGWHYAIDGYVSVLATLAIWGAVGAGLDRFGVVRAG
jgi:hypothetical protein